ncbi:MAG TPA: ABC transporter permease subunit [Dehalococcoidia bacterium]|nr:ABC transporter permease subunit [Dehalococcoidia bacterium]
MNAVTAVARKEVRDALNNWWLLLYAGLFALLALGLAYLGQRNLGSLGFENFSRTTASLLNLCLLLAPLIALSLGAGAIAGERDRGTLTYLLSQPLDRWELLVGKFAGLFASIALATAAGFGLAGVFIAFYASAMDAGTYLLFLALVLALIAVMTGLGLVASVVSPTRVQALGLALVVWFVAVFFFDLVFIGLVSSTSLGGGGLLLALLSNPVEIVRVLAIIHLEPDLEVLGPFGAYLMERVGVGGATAILGAALVAWVAAPVTLAAWLFEARDA